MKYIMKYILLTVGMILAVVPANAQNAAKEVRAMAVFDGRLWAIPLTGAGLVFYDGGEWKKAPEADTLLSGAGASSLAAVHGRLYAGTTRGLLVKEGAAWLTVMLPVSGVIGVTALAADGNGLLISTSAGLFRIDAPGSVPKLMLGSDFQAGSGGNAGAAVSNVRIFPPPDPASQVVEDSKSPVSAASKPDKPSKEAPFWTNVSKPARPQPKYFADILPVMTRECMPCHTSGTGKYFSLNDPKTVLRYFKQGGLARFEQFREEGGGMAGKVVPQTAKMIHIWAVNDCPE